MSGIEVAVGLAFATPPVTDLVIKAGKELVNRVAEIQNADKLVRDLTVFGVESARQRMRTRFSIGSGICNDPRCSEDLKDVIDKTFIEVQENIILGTTQVNSCLLANKKKRAIFHRTTRRQALEATVEKLKDLCKVFDDTVMLVRMHESGHSPTYLFGEVFQTHKGTKIKISENIYLQQCQLVSHIGRTTPRTSQFLLEARPYTQASKSELEEDLRCLTKLLAGGAHSEGVLDVVGYADQPEDECFQIVFALPDDFGWGGTLQNRIRETHGRPPLDLRIGLCAQLVESVLHVHSLDLVHKNISTANIIVTTTQNTESGTANDTEMPVFLINWQLVRRASAATRRGGEKAWWKAMYLHPNRQMALAQSDYRMGHDIYSLGVCMLEIALWKPLVETTTEGPVISTVFKEKAEGLGILQKNRAEARDFLSESELCTADPKAVQIILLDLAKTELPAVVGSKFSKLVISCLSCLEDGFAGVSFEGEKVETGMNYMALVKASLGQICV